IVRIAGSPSKRSPRRDEGAQTAAAARLDAPPSGSAEARDALIGRRPHPPGERAPRGLDIARDMFVFNERCRAADSLRRSLSFQKGATMGGIRCGVVLLLAAVAARGQVRPLSLRDLCSGAERIVIGGVEKLECRWQGSMIVTDVTIAPAENLKGAGF